MARGSESGAPARTAKVAAAAGVEERPGVMNPTLLIGVGAFGREVVRRTARGGERIASLEHLEVESARPAAEIVAEAKVRARALLDLGHFVASTAPTDRRGPRCDVLVVADLGEPGVAEAIAPLCAALAEGLRAEFHPILRAGAGALVVCPLLSAPRAADRARVGGAAAALARVASDADPGKRLEGRVYVVEDQSGKYLLSREELERAFAAFLHLLLFSRLRDDDLGIRHLVERAPVPGERGGPFATFACATLEFDHATFVRLCAVKLAREVLRAFRTGDDPAIAEIAARAGPLVPERGALEEALWRESETGSLAKHLEPPAIEVPAIEADDSPERIVEQLFGPVWRAGVARRIEAFRDDVERFKMDRLAAGIERNGKATLEATAKALAERVDAEVASGPRGHARALEILRDAHTRAKGLYAEVSSEIESPDLAPFPASPLDAKIAALEEAAFARPRAYRMRVFGVLGAALGACLVAAAIVGGYRALVAPHPSFFDPSEVEPDGLARWIAAWPMPYLLGAALSGSSTYYRLWKHRKRHHNWVLEARDDLDQALRRYLHTDAVGYFQRRLHYTRLLWVQRVYKRLTLAIEEAMARLEAVRASLTAADEALGGDERVLDERLEAGVARAGILFRGLLAPADAHSVYLELKPREAAPVAERWLREAIEEASWHGAPFARPEALLAFCDRELAIAASMCPFRWLPAGDGHGPAALERFAADALRDFLRQLALKLSPPLETVETVAPSSRAPSRIAVVPPEAKPLVEATLAEEDLGGGWEVRALSGDLRRVHLVVDRGDLPLEALALARGAPR